MKIAYLINTITKTSVPIGWSKYIKNNFKNLNISLVSIKQFSLKNLKQIVQSNILHGHHIKVMAILIFLNFIFNKQTVYTVHGSYLYLSEDNKKLLKYILKRVNKVIFVNKFLYDALPNELKDMIKNKYKIILNGVDIDFKYKKTDVYSKFNISQDDKIIFHPARFVKEKNHINVIKSFKLLQQIDAKTKLILAGDGVLKLEILAIIEELDLKDHVVLLGLIDREEVYSFLEKCDLFIMPSISEGLNIAFLEAMSMNTKILVSDIEQFTYPFKHYALKPLDYNVYFANPNNVENLFNGLVQALNSKKNQNFDMNIFSLKNMMKEYKVIYEEVLS